MSRSIIDNVEEIARHLKELEADQQLALTGSTVPEKVGEVATMWGYVNGQFYDPYDPA